MNKNIKNTLEASNGITLIALVITIIVLLILAGISISMLSGDNGILQRATQSKEKTERAEIIETAQMDILGKQTENSGDITENELKEILIKYGALSKDEENILDKILTTTKGNYEIAVSEIYNGELKPPKAGLYNAETDDLIYSWDKLLELGNMINVNNGALSRSAFTIPNDIAKVRLVITDNGTVTSITGLQSISKLKEVVIPAAVTSISNSAFGGNQDLVSVKMSSGGSGLTIGNGAFGGCSNLTNVELLGNVTSIGSTAFASCSSLISVKLPNGKTIIGNNAFSGCTNLTNVELSENTVSIGQSTFAGCSKLTNFTIPENVTIIEPSTFASCSSLASIVITENVTSIGNGAFSGCNGLTNLSIFGNPTGLNGSTFPKNNLKSITLGSNNTNKGLTTIPQAICNGCQNLESVIINRSVTSIETAAFMGCTSLTSITIPNSVTSIGISAFNGCTGLTSIIIPESVTTLGAAALDGCSSLHELTICGKLTSFIATSGAENPTATDYSGPYSLKKMESLKKITLGSDDVDLGLKTIPLRAFQGFTYVETVEIKPSVTSIGDYAFISCMNLQNINMSNGLNSIGSHAFNNCSNLESIRIPENITSIGNYAFFSCTSLESIIVNKTNNSISGAPWGAPNMTSNDVVWNE